MPLLTETQYAERIGRDRSWIRQLRLSGRLVIVGDLIDAVASDERIAATAAGAHAVATRHALEREEKSDAREPQDSARQLSYRDRKIAADALRAETLAQRELLELEQAAGKLVDVEHVRQALSDLGTHCRVEIENQPGQLAGELVGLQTIDEVERAIAKFNRDMLTRISERLRAQARKVGG